MTNIALCLSRFVLENSGVAEPQNIRDKFSEAIAEGHPLMQRLFLDTLVTVVDAGVPSPRLICNVERPCCSMRSAVACPVKGFFGPPGVRACPAQQASGTDTHIRASAPQH